MNLDQVMKAKEGSVKGLTGGIAHLFKKNGVTRVEGHGSLAGPNKDRFTSTVVSDQWSPPKKIDHVEKYTILYCLEYSGPLRNGYILIT